MINFLLRMKDNLIEKEIYNDTLNKNNHDNFLFKKTPQENNESISKFKGNSYTEETPYR